ncbi:MAG: ATP-dependent helicase, partial [Candidatus Hydrogenedentes bacterium]|nr:ATP-dependent helicase [Candidatus Hydrogenedentota bacterium]
MKMDALIRYEIPPAILGLWRERESEELLPLQELAVKRYGLFGGGNLLVQAPTSSGKTFIGEMAAIQAALRRKKVVYLVPLKALAEEKYREFKEKYTEYGLKVIVSTRDRREFDGDLEHGNFSIAVVVYEKLSQLLVRRPERIEEIALIVADELELLSDPERGGMAEVLLTRILQTSARVIGLSAVIGEADRLAQWLRAELVVYERRPVELRYGVLHEGTFRYRTYNEYGEGEETLLGG